MIDSIITNKTRIKLLLRFFLNTETRGYLRNLETEFGESTNSIRIELNRFEEAGLLVSKVEKNKKIFQANISHPLFREINSIVRKSVGLDQMIEKIVKRIGGVRRAYITGELARGLDTREVDLAIIVDDYDKEYLSHLITKVQELVKRKINCILLKEEEEPVYIGKAENKLLIWEENTV
jgi:predicted nucleotidyltransferase